MECERCGAYMHTGACPYCDLRSPVGVTANGFILGDDMEIVGRRPDIEYGDKLQRGSAPVEVREVAGEARTLRFVASTERVARDGDIVRAKGWDTKEFMRNPVFLWSHDPSQPPIGKVTALTKQKDPPRLEADVQFAGPEEGHEFADTIYRLYRRGFLKAVSVGFMVRSYEKPTDEQREEMKLGPFGVVITSAELMELSAVAVPSDPGALKIGKDDRQARADLVRIRGLLPEQSRAAIDEILDDSTDEPAPPTITIDSVRDLLTDMMEEMTVRISASVVDTLAEQFASREAARDTTAPEKPALQSDPDDLYRLRDALDRYLTSRKESH